MHQDNLTIKNKKKKAEQVLKIHLVEKAMSFCLGRSLAVMPDLGDGGLQCLGVFDRILRDTVIKETLRKERRQD